MSALALGLPPCPSSVSHVDGTEERIEHDAQAVLASITPARDDHLGAARAPVREEEDLHHPVTEGLAAAHVLDDGAAGEHRPAAPAGGVDAVLDGVDDQLLRLAERHRLAPAVVHGGRDLARRAAHLARLVAALDHGHDERAPDGDDDEHHHHLEEGEAGCAARTHPLSPSLLVMSRLSPSPPGPPSAP